MFAAFTTAAHFCVSAAMKVERPLGEPTSGLALSLARIASISLVLIIALISVLSLLTIDVGVPAGASMADQYVAFNFGHPLSTVVGTAGKLRALAVADEARSLQPSRASSRA